MIARIQNLVSRFRKDDDGAITVEFALMSPLLVGLLLASLELGTTGFTQKNLTSSLRFAGQYVSNGGSDLDVAENVFARSYGSYENFSAEISCSCANSRDSLESDETGAATTASTLIGAITGDTGDAPQCTASCGDAPTIRYLRFSASALSRPILGTDYTRVSNSVSVRLK